MFIKAVFIFIKKLRYKRERTLHLCPACKVKQYDLPRHLRTIHGWSQESSVSAIGKFGLRKKCSKTVNRKYCHNLKMCPVSGCGVVTKNPGEHLRSKKHSLFPNGSTKVLYQQLLKEAKLFDPSQMPDQTDCSPSKDYGIVRNRKKTSLRSIDNCQESPALQLNR